MFEASLIESQGRLVSGNQRWTAALSVTLQCSLVAGIIAIPLLHPETLAFHPEAPKIALQVKPALLPRPKLERSQAAPSTSLLPAMARSFTAPTHILRFDPSSQDVAPMLNITGPMGSSAGPENILGNVSTNTTAGPHVTMVPATPKRPVLISRGVSQGLLLAPIRPVYPRVAIATRTEGTVVVDAIISKVGTIESIRVASGPEMLRTAAIDAIRIAHYSPYLLNGLPTEVETTITGTFRLAGSS